MRNIIVFERIFEGSNGEEIKELDFRLKGLALPMHSCPVAMVYAGEIMQWEALEYQWDEVRRFAMKQAGLPVYVNTCERYGESVNVTVKDYQDLNAEGQFEERTDGIYELLDPMGETAGLNREYPDDVYQWFKIADRE